MLQLVVRSHQPNPPLLQRRDDIDMPHRNLCPEGTRQGIRLLSSNEDAKRRPGTFGGDSSMLEIVCFDPFVLNLRELSSDNIELHPNEDISKESLRMFAFANLRMAILPLSPPGR
jgi:hypothetical protein